MENRENHFVCFISDMIIPASGGGEPRVYPRQTKRGRVGTRAYSRYRGVVLGKYRTIWGVGMAKERKVLHGPKERGRYRLLFSPILKFFLRLSFLIVAKLPASFFLYGWGGRGVTPPPSSTAALSPGDYHLIGCQALLSWFWKKHHYGRYLHRDKTYSRKDLWVRLLIGSHLEQNLRKNEVIYGY